MIQKLAKQLNCGEAALIVSLENRTYFTGFESSNGYLFVSQKGSVFITDSRYIESAKNQVKSCDDVILQTQLKTQLVEVAKKLGANKILLEAQKTTIANYDSYKKIFSDFEVSATGELDDFINELRAIKSQEEKENIIKAQRIAEKSFDLILGYIRPGKTEREIACRLDYFMLKNGADAISFKTIVVSGKNSSKPHGEPSEKRFEIGDFITMDFGACIKGYHSDMTRTVALGDVSSRQAKVYDTVLSAQLSAIDTVCAGVVASECDLVARQIIEHAGYGENFGHGTGHGVGIEIHEKPTVSKNSTEILQAGNIITIEPGIYIENSFGVRIEDMLFVKHGGSENLTNAPKALMVL
ncbi:MAG: aminopeptidase P family protein [Clostridiales bacterium]|nr:aminopeptidase P family protein [Clostridiales bacterium]